MVDTSKIATSELAGVVESSSLQMSNEYPCTIYNGETYNAIRTTVKLAEAPDAMWLDKTQTVEIFPGDRLYREEIYLLEQALVYVEGKFGEKIFYWEVV